MKCLFFLSVCVFGLTGISFADVTFDSLTWEGVLDCNDLPTEAGWHQVMTGGSWANNFVDYNETFITVNSMGTNAAPYWYSDDQPIDFSTGFSIEWKVKLVNADAIDVAICNLYVRSSTLKAYMGINIGQVELNTTTAGMMDTQDGFHVYRMIIQDSNVTLFVNDPGNSNPEPLKVTTALSNSTGAVPMIRFGDVAGDPDGEYQIEYIRWTDSGAFPPENASSLCTIPIGDFDENCVVDFADLAIFAANWLVCGYENPEDCP